MIRFNVTAKASKHHVSNAHQLAAYAGLTLPVAYRVWDAEPLQRIEVATLETLARAFRCKPFALLEHLPDDDEQPPPKPKASKKAR